MSNDCLNRFRCDRDKGNWRQSLDTYLLLGRLTVTMQYCSLVDARGMAVTARTNCFVELVSVGRWRSALEGWPHRFVELRHLQTALICLIGLSCWHNAGLGQDRAELDSEFAAIRSPTLTYATVRSLNVSGSIQPGGGLLVFRAPVGSPLTKMTRIRDGVGRIMIEPSDQLLSVNGNRLDSLETLDSLLRNSQGRVYVNVWDHNSRTTDDYWVDPVTIDMPVAADSAAYGDVAYAYSPTRLHVLLVNLVTNPNDPLKQMVDLTLGNVTTTLQSEIEPGMLTIYDRISEDRCSAQQIVSAIDNLTTGRRDSILVFIGGHGGYDPNYATDDPAGGHFLDMDNGDLLRRTVWEHLLAKRSKLRVLITDTCNVQQKMNRGQRYFLRGAGRPTGDASASEWLFLGHKGNLDFAAARRDQYSWYSSDVGGWFTSQLVQQLNETPHRSWTPFLIDVQQRTKEYFATQKQSMAGSSSLPANTAMRLQSQTDQLPTVFRAELEREAEPPILAEDRVVVADEP